MRNNVAALVSLGFMLALAACGSGEPEKPPPAAQLGSCRFPLPDKVTTVVYSAYAGGASSEWRLENRPNALVT
jgi:predicted small lipoprotein YifL